MISPLELAVGIGLLLAAGWSGAQAWLAFETRPAFLSAAGFLAAFGTKSVILSTSLALAPVPRLLANLAACAAFCCLAVWFLCALYDRPHRRVLAQFLALFIALGIAVAAWASDPGQVQRGLAGGAGLRGAAAVTFAVTIELYLALAEALLVWLSIMRARHAMSSAARYGFTIFTIGLLLHALMNCSKVAMISAAVISGGWSATLLNIYLSVWVLRAPSDALMLAGAGYSAVVSLLAALPLWRAHRRDHLRLQSLRRLVYSAFPEHALEPVPSLWRDWLLPVRVHWRFYRCLIETLDGLDQLRPFYDQTVAERAEADARAAGLAGPDRDNQVRSAVVCAAVHTHTTVTRLSDATATVENLGTGAREVLLFKSLTAGATRRQQAGLVYRGLDDIEDGTTEQVTHRLIALSTALTRNGRMPAGVGSPATP